MRRLLVAVLVLLAGCNGGDPLGGAPFPTLTPANVPGDGSIALVSHGGVAEAPVLLAAHQEYLATHATTHGIFAGMYTTGPDYDYVLTVARNESQFRATLRFDVQRRVGETVETNRTFHDYYHTGDRGYQRVERAGVVSFHQLPADTDPPFETVRTDQLYAVLVAADLRVANSRTDEGYYRVYAESFPVDRLPTFRGVVTDATVSGFYATITPDGYVTRYWFRYDGTLDGAAVSGWFRISPGVALRFREPGYVDKGPGPGVEVPDWYAEAVNATAPSPTETPVATG
jgi:hypothetical protein